jgi:hypothetical protein
MDGVCRTPGRQDDPQLKAISASLDSGIQSLEKAVQFVVSATDPRTSAAGVARRQLDAGVGDAAFQRAKLITARFYADHVLSAASDLAHAVLHGADATPAMEDG